MDRCFFIPSEKHSDIYSYQNSERYTMATIIHSILFEGELFLSDASIVNVPHLRSCFENPKFFKLVDNEKIKIVQKEIDGTYRPLTKTADEILRENTVNPSFSNSPVDFRDYSVLITLDQYAQRTLYRENEAKKFYTDGISNFYSQNDLSEQLPNKVHRVLNDLINEQKDKHGFLASAYLQREYNVGHDLDQRTGQKDSWSKYGSFLMNSSMAYYYGFIPNKTETSPMYGSEYKSVFDIWRGTVESTEEIIDSKPLTTHLEPHSFVEGILKLEYEDVCRLTESDEYKAFKKKSKEVQNSQRAFEDLVRSFTEYKKRVNLEVEQKLGTISNHEYKEDIRFGWKKRKKIANDTLSEFIYLKIMNASTIGITSYISLANKIVKTLVDPLPDIQNQIDHNDKIDKIKHALDPNATSHPTLAPTTHVTDSLTDTMFSYTKN